MLLLVFVLLLEEEDDDIAFVIVVVVVVVVSLENESGIVGCAAAGAGTMESRWCSLAGKERVAKLLSSKNEKGFSTRFESPPSTAAASSSSGLFSSLVKPPSLVIALVAWSTPMAMLLLHPELRDKPRSRGSKTAGSIIMSSSSVAIIISVSGNNCRPSRSFAAELERLQKIEYNKMTGWSDGDDE